jgi:hypothetical protein
MEDARNVKVSPSEKRTLEQLAEGELHASELDWVALQHLRKLGWAEQRPGGVAITKEGRLALRRFLSRV